MYKTRSEMLEAAAVWAKVCEANGLDMSCKFEGGQRIEPSLRHNPELYEFPVAYIENKLVYKGDKVRYIGSNSPYINKIFTVDRSALLDNDINSIRTLDGFIFYEKNLTLKLEKPEDKSEEQALIEQIRKDLAEIRKQIESFKTPKFILYP